MFVFLDNFICLTVYNLLEDKTFSQVWVIQTKRYYSESTILKICSFLAPLCMAAIVFCVYTDFKAYALLFNM